MKQVISALIVAACMMGSCSIAQTVAPKKILIVYLSRTNNTKAIAEIIHKHVGGKLVALELKTPYPENYQQTVQQVVDENESGFLPPLKNGHRQYGKLWCCICRISNLGDEVTAAN